MKSNEHKLVIQKKARYYTLGSPSDKIKNIWFVLHGYGNAAAGFINNFEIINNGKNYIIAPEALNKFYLKGFNGKVGATWMTKENRNDEIEDYINFLNSVYYKEAGRFNENITITVLGFSQGCPTAVRWLENLKCKADNLILWAGDLPHDSDAESLKSVLRKLSVHFVIGEDDQIISNDVLERELKKYSQFDVEYKLHKFKGGHEIDEHTLSEISSELNTNN